MPTINDYKKKALNNLGYLGDINTAESKWLKAICSPYVGAIPDMWRYALKQMGFTGGLIEMQNEFLKILGYSDASISNKWYKYWKNGTSPIWGLEGSVLDLDFANSRGYNSKAPLSTTPDSLLTYTSPSPKMVYGDDGVLRYAPHNLLTQSYNVSNAVWTKTAVVVTSGQADSLGGTSAFLCTESDSGAILRRASTTTVSSGMLHTVSFELKNSNFDWVRVIVGTDTTLTNSHRVWVNVATGAIGTNAIVGTGYGYVSAYVSAATGGFYRVTVVVTAPTTTMCVAVVSAASDGSTARANVGGGAGIGSAYITGNFDVTLGASAAPIIPTTTAAVYSLPIDHDPITFDPLGVLIEGQRTNLLTYSEQFDNAAWTVSSAVSVNNTTAPDGTTTADLISRSGISYAVYNTAYVVVTANTTYTFSFWAKFGTAVGLTIAAYDGSNSAFISTDITPTTVPSDNGWTRCIATFTTPTGCTLLRVYPDRNTANTGTFWLWGAQLEAGAFPTSYIPTVASQVTRAADQVSILTSAFAYNAAAGTVAVDVTLGQGGGGLALFDDGTANNQISTGAAPGNGFSGFFVKAATVVQADVFAGSTAAPGDHKQAAAWQANDFTYYTAGVQRGTPDTSGSIPNVTKLNFGIDRTAYLNGHIKRLTYFPTRRSNADLQVLST